jgi:hypothetical protein
MNTRRSPVPWLLLASTISYTTPSIAAQKPIAPSKLRWSASLPGATISITPDGKYIYALRSGDKNIAVTIDSQEPEKSRRRHAAVFSAHILIRNLGERYWKASFAGIRLEFVKHFHVIQPALDPADLSQQLQASADELDHQTAVERLGPPTKGRVDEAYLRAYQKETSEFIEFVSRNSLQETVLDAGNPQAEGWVYFSTRNKWLSKWKPQETFILRLPLDGVVYEFPFSLPPRPGEATLRQR